MYIQDYIKVLAPVDHYERGLIVKIELRSILMSRHSLKSSWDYLPGWVQEELKTYTKEHFAWLARQNEPGGSFWLGGKREEHMIWQKQLDENYDFIATLL